jgi:hypothetical protein
MIAKPMTFAEFEDLPESDSARASDDEARSRGLFQFRDPNGMSAQKVFNLGRPVIAVLEMDHLWRSAAGPGEVEKIGISRYNGEAVGPCILPNSFVRGGPGETRVENVDRIGEKLRKTAHELRREIRVK